MCAQLQMCCCGQAVCCCSGKLSELSTYQNELDSLTDLQWYCFLIISISVGVSLFSCFLFFLLKFCYRDNPNFIGIKLKLRIVHYFFRVTQVPLIIIAIKHAKYSKEFFSFFDEQKCSDATTNQLFYELSKKFGQQTFYYDIILISFVFIMFLLDLAFMIFICYREKVINREQDDLNLSRRRETAQPLIDMV